MVLRRIEQREHEATISAQAQASAREMRDQQIAQEKERERQERLQLEEQNKRIKNQTLHESGVLRGLQEIIQGKIEGVAKKYELLVDSEHGSATLVWGNSFAIKEGAVWSDDGPFGWFRFRKLDCRIIAVDASENEAVEIGWGGDRYGFFHIPGRVKQGRDNYSFGVSKIIFEEDWKANPDLIADVLAEAFLHPLKLKDTDEKPTGPEVSHWQL